MFLKYLADRWRVVLKGEYPDYINAVFVNVSIITSTPEFVLLELKEAAHIYLELCTGLQAAEGFHHSPRSHGVHLQRLLEDGP